MNVTNEQANEKGVTTSNQISKSSKWSSSRNGLRQGEAQLEMPPKRALRLYCLSPGRSRMRLLTTLFQSLPHVLQSHFPELGGIGLNSWGFLSRKSGGNENVSSGRRASPSLGSMQSGTLPFSGNVEQDIFSGQSKPYFFMTGKQLERTCSQTDRQTGIGSSYVSRQIGVYIEQRKTLMSGEHLISMSALNWLSSIPASFCEVWWN